LIADFEELKPDATNKFGGLNLILKYDNNICAISSLKRISKPGRRVYVAKDKIPAVRNNFGISIISTSAGIMSNKEAKKAGVGGEVLCEIY